ncbi:hypothetical protein H112_08522 [Trichophyton rubrum D6]|nr:hypothetical protein H100_08545 [Trichophyton rubrum MR850]EZF37018.1 hypothetical protein H102_08504 [Trichophyton rubrum CBS 100081]EZF47793.1 hypothetical protein H103_08526 [Trichophyton rubrum CBS 288.86]EZF58310.1 hypothetical protein H104_08478 [Trichophyton rubrum CBS 289.86]EZF79596.1 hypothetical protein H110_08528 [Trichophyton rubrum MR1448]EZF89936.1 hypothetical protein H113_08597 [Trichophyton rubrum MR1459]EZG01046.1 hypothetical protein H106_08403 [Trichophyton rubrum CBS 
MRFADLSILTITMAGSTVVAIPSLSCLKLPSVIQSFDAAKVGTIFQKEFCGRGCGLIPSNYETQIKPFVTKFFEDECTTMGAPTLAPYYINMVDTMFQGAKECSGGKFRDVNLCGSENETLEEVLGCFQSSAISALWEKKASILPLLTTNCEEQYKYFAVDNIYNNRLPACAQMFAAENCKAA